MVVKKVSVVSNLPKASLKHSQLMEILYIMASAYVIYAVAEKLHSSGIIATLFGSMLMGIYAILGRKAYAEIMGMLRFLLWAAACRPCRRRRWALKPRAQILPQ